MDPTAGAAASTGMMRLIGAAPGDITLKEVDLGAVGTGEAGPGAELVAHLGDALETLAAPQPARGHALEPTSDAVRDDLLTLFEAQATSRWLDVLARRLAAARLLPALPSGAGHEGNAVVAMASRADDPALLHARSGAFYLARSAQTGSMDGVFELAEALAGSADQPLAGGRYPAFGHPDLAILPQTSTTAAHLPRGLGIAWALGRQSRSRERASEPLRWPDDAISIVSFGDGGAQHSNALGAINSACWAARQGVAIPLLLVCEDNGFGGSLPTPPGWIRELFDAREGLRYLHARSDGDPLELLETARRAVALTRTHRRPVLLHLSCVRIGGQDSTDTEMAYRRPERIASDLRRDPLVATMRALVHTGTLSVDDVAEGFLQARDRVELTFHEAVRRPTLETGSQVMVPLAPHRPAAVAMVAARVPAPAARSRVFPDGLPETEGPLTLAQALNRSLLDAAAALPGIVMLGTDIGRRGGRYGVTAGMHAVLGPARVTDTVPDENSILGLALGAAVSGLLPIVEVSSLAHLHAAQEQVRAEAMGLSFHSSGAFRNPMVLRVPGLSHEFGGEVGLGILRDVPGLVVACPAHPSEVPGLVRTVVAAADADGMVSVLLEPVALYHERDMLRQGDGAWTAPYPEPDRWGSQHAPIGRAATWGDGTDLTLCSFGTGLQLVMRVAAQLEQAGVSCRVVDLRWLSPLPVDDVVREADATGRLLIVDETRRTGGVSEALVTGVLEAGFDGRLARVTARDTILPYGRAASLVTVSPDEVLATAQALVSG
ncbi:transketolase C-terminal domain-containing protein [Spongisporangium articulatum]|uniref:Transketolase C-terminal domain-containing protein n=1 Tax=Spongisporangium articulatum TaxID=3362603 RepID=A0ABW8AJ92_9ACTN